MDISGIYGRQPIRALGPGKVSGETGFKAIFEKKVSAVSETGTPAPGSVETDLIEQSGKVLDLLDTYIEELNNPEKTLRDIDPLVKTIEAELTRLESGSTDSTAGDAGINGFVKELTVTANVALYKFRRGDYL